MERLNPDVEGAASRSAEEAQQLSAWACVKAIESDGCIGHVAPSEQHAIRASGAAVQPAQTEAGPAAKPSTSTRRTAEERLLTSSTLIRMRERRGTVNGRPSLPYCCLQVQFVQPCSAHVSHDSVTRLLSASRARNRRTAA